MANASSPYSSRGEASAKLRRTVIDSFAISVETQSLRVAKTAQLHHARTSLAFKRLVASMVVPQHRPLDPSSTDSRVKGFGA
jgi:hypothetical protein